MRLAGWFLARGEPATREEIYAAFPDDYSGSAEAKEKKWTRDKSDLRRVGIPVRFVEMLDERGAYTVDAGSYQLPRLEFTPEEASVLWIAGWGALRNPDHPMREDLEIALRKLAVGAQGLTPRAAAPGAPRENEGGKMREWLDVLADAVERRKRVRLSYRKLGGDVSERLVDPYGYAWRRGEWLFVGYCHSRQARRVFYLDRVRSLVLDPAERKKPDYEIPADFDIRTWSRQEPWDFLVHEPVEAVVRFRGSLARIAARLVPGAKVATATDNSRVARFPVHNLRGLARQALAWGPEAEIVEPARGREMVREMLSALRPHTAREGSK